jgi:APA family basic amino acid/polyamine antiporter
MLGTGTTMLIYLALNAVFVLVPPFASVVSREDIAAIAAEAVGGTPMSTVVRLVIVLALFTSVSAMVMVGPRVYAKMADDGLFPPALRLKGETPTAAVVLQGVLAVAVVWITGLRELLSYLGFTLGLSTVVTVASLFVVVRRDPSRARRLSGYPWAPAVFVLSTLLFTALAANVNPWEMVAALVTIGSGALLYVFARGRWPLVR